MTTLWLACRRVWYVIRRRRVDADLSEEMAFHRDMKERELLENGTSPADASRAARRAFGSTALAENQARDVWIQPWLQDIAQDLRFAARLLLKERRFTIASLLALSLGIAANTTVFTFIDAALFKSLPFDRPDQLASIGTVDRRGREAGVSHLDFTDWQRATHAFSLLAASSEATMNVSDDGQAPQRARGSYISANTFELLRTQPALGRGFRSDDESPAAPAVVILGHDVWQKRYGSDPAIVGRTIRVNGEPAAVVGVMPARFRYPMIQEVWQPLSRLPEAGRPRRDVRTLNVVGRLTDAATMEVARAELAVIAERLSREHPETNRDIAPTVDAPMARARRGARPILFTMMGAVAFVLLIGCANVANLLLARAAHRAREMAIRASLGATRWRIVRQLLIESVLLAAIAGIAGLWLSVYGVRYFGVAFDAMEIGDPTSATTPYWVDLGMDRRVFAFVAALCLGSGILFGLAPALHVAFADVNGVLKESGPSAGGSLRSRHWSGALMIGELALTLVLLAGAGLMMRSFVRHYQTNLVIDTRNAITARVALSGQRYSTRPQQQAFIDTLEARLAPRAPIVSAALASDIPFVPLNGFPRQLSIDGAASTEPPASVSYVRIDRRFFETLGIQIVRGRGFTDAETATGEPVAIVNERFAAVFFAGNEALQRRIRLGPAAPGAADRWLTIVGVSQTLPQFAPEQIAPEALVYVPLNASTEPVRFASVIVRSTSDIARTAAVLRNEVRAIDPDLPLFAIQTMGGVVANTRYPLRIMGSLFALLAITALVLASVGLFALTAHGVAVRRHEIGIRMALGAQARHVTWLFVRRTLLQLAAGLALGVAGALAIGRLLETFLFATGARDAVSLASVTALLVVVSTAASLLPARRAARLDPVVALRHE